LTSLWRLLSALLVYPSEELIDACDELTEAVAALPRPRERSALGAFLDWLQSEPLAELEKTYVQTFDFGRRASLHLTYHTHGDRRQRGLELIRLKRRYAQHGLPLTDTELPDYLPAMLEFAALAEPGVGAALLSEFRSQIELVRAQLHRDGSPYADLLDALCDALPKPTRAQVELSEKLALEGPPTELVGLEPFTAVERSPLEEVHT
jgi:nitrate reductase delta subunit